MATINMHMKFEIEIPKQTWLMLRKPCRLQTDGRTDGQTDKVNPVYPPSNFIGRGYKKNKKTCADILEKNVVPSKYHDLFEQYNKGGVTNITNPLKIPI